MKKYTTPHFYTSDKMRKFECILSLRSAMKKSLSTLCALLLLVLLPSARAQTSQSVRTIQSGHLYGVDASSGFDVTLKQGGSSHAEIRIDSRLEPYLTVEVRNGILHLGLHNVPQELQRQLMHKTVRQADITLNALQHLDVHSGTRVVGEGSFTTEECTIDVHSGATVESIDLQATTVKLLVRSGASATLSGKTHTLDVSTSSGASADVTNLSAVQVNAKASSGSGIRCWPTESLNAEASSGASIRFKGGVLHNSRRHSSSGGSIKGL